MARKRGFVSKLLLDFVLTAFSLFNIIPNLLVLFESETKAAVKSISTLLLLYLIAGCVITTTWLCFLALLLIYLISIHLSWLLSLFILFVINILILYIIIRFALKAKHHLSFYKSRRLLRKL
jgi:hypothetical protein